jgi:hypothetical protein
VICAQYSMIMAGLTPEWELFPAINPESSKAALPPQLRRSEN